MTIRLATTVLPADSAHNGLDAIAHRFVEDSDTEVLALVRLKTKTVEDDREEHTLTPKVRIVHIEPVTVDDDVATLRRILDRLIDERRAAGQLSLDDSEPSIMRERLAELDELADDLGVTPAALKTEFGDYYGIPPEGATPDQVAEFLFRRRQDVPAPAAGDDDAPRIPDPFATAPAGT